MSTIDLRGFDYALEPLRQRLRWQLDALQARFACLQIESAAAHKELEVLRASHAAAAGHAAGRVAQQVDPHAHARSLQWLAQLREQMMQSQMRCDRLRADCKQAGRDCLSHQQRIDAVEAHRDESVAEFAQDALRRHAVEADREWLARPAPEGVQL